MPGVGRTIEERTLKGIPVSDGVCQGKVVVIGKPHDVVVPRYEVPEGEFPREWERFQQALIRTRGELEEIQGHVNQAMGADQARIFDAQLLFLEDPVVLGEVRKLLAEERLNVEAAFDDVAAKYFAIMSQVDDGYFRERVSDLRDIAQRMLRHLLEVEIVTSLSQIREPCILVAHDLTPSQTALLDRRMVLGFSTDLGSETSHTAILARSLRLPAVTGLIDATEKLQTGTQVLLDGFTGLVIVDPAAQTLYEYGQLAKQQVVIEERLRLVKGLPAETLDKHRVILSANIENPEEVADVHESGAEGVGLLRTEYLFLDRVTLPTEDEQFAAYDRVAREVHPHPVIIRTLDVGGDKASAHWPTESERNPFMGWRAIRICLQERDVFRNQLRAVLRASVNGNVKIMYPMVSSVGELEQANAALEECRGELRAEGIPFDEKLEVGVMIEIPAAAMVARAMAQRVDFFSIGTNDLIQYSLAVDRSNPKVAHLYEPTHPGVLGLIKMTIDAGLAEGIWTGVCGEMAGDPTMVPLLLGLGAAELSTAPSRLPAVKFLIRHIGIEVSRQLANEALQIQSGPEILRRSRELVRKAAPELWERAEPMRVAGSL